MRDTRRDVRQKGTRQKQSTREVKVKQSFCEKSSPSKKFSTISDSPRMLPLAALRPIRALPLSISSKGKHALVHSLVQQLKGPLRGLCCALHPCVYLSGGVFDAAAQRFVCLIV